MPSTSPSSSPATRSPRLSAELHTFVEGRRLDDNAHMMLRFTSGAKGMLWCSQVASGHRERPAHPHLRREGRSRMASGEPELPDLLAARRAAAPDPPQRLRRRRGLSRRLAHPGRTSGRLSRGLRPALHRCRRADRGPDREARAQSLRASGADRRPRRARRALHRSGGALVAAQGRLGRSVDTAKALPHPQGFRAAPLKSPPQS